MDNDWETENDWFTDQIRVRDQEGLVKMLETVLENVVDWEIHNWFGPELEAGGFFKGREGDYLDYELTYDEAVVRFNEGAAQHIIKHYGIDDRIALAEGWNNWTDALCKDGEITDFQYNNWDNPF